MIIISIVGDKRSYLIYSSFKILKIKTQKLPNFFIVFCKEIATGIVVILLVYNATKIQNVPQM